MTPLSTGTQVRTHPCTQAWHCLPPWSFFPRQSIFEREVTFRYGLLKHGHHSSQQPSHGSQRRPHRPLSNSKQASPSVSANLERRTQTARQGGPSGAGRKPGCGTNAHCPLREPLGLPISRERETTLGNSGGPEGLMFLILPALLCPREHRDPPGLHGDREHPSLWLWA